MPDEWLLISNGRRTGPFTLSQLREMAGRGRLAYADQLSADGGRTWKSAHLLRGVFPRPPKPEIAPPVETRPAYEAPRPTAPKVPPTPPPSPQSAGETVVWSGSPSQLVHLGTYIVCGVFCWLVIPLFVAMWRWLEVRNTRYDLTTERLRIARGVLARSVNDVELYRVRDSAFRQTFIERLLGLATIEVAAADIDAPRILIAGLPHATAWELRESLRIHTEHRRDAKGVRAIEA